MGCTTSSRAKAEAPTRFMCGEKGHLAKECPESKFFLSRGICRLNIETDRVVLGDYSPLPRAEGEGGAARVIRGRLSSATQVTSSTGNVEVESFRSEYEEAIEFVTLGTMDFGLLQNKRCPKSHISVQDHRCLQF